MKTKLREHLQEDSHNYRDMEYRPNKQPPVYGTNGIPLDGTGKYQLMEDLKVYSSQTGYLST